jgi:hypothetical protein
MASWEDAGSCKQLTYPSPHPLSQLFDVGTAEATLTVPIVVGSKPLYPRHGIAYLWARQAMPELISG